MFHQLKKMSVTAATLLCILALLGACGSNSSNNSNAASSAASPTAESSPAADSNNTATTEEQSATRIVKTVKGDIEVPTNPQRIVAGYYHGTLLSLGIQPIGASKEWWMGSPFLKEQEAKITDIGSPASAEKVLALQPDLILINDTLAENYDDLSKIAPTLFIPYNSIKNVHDEVKQFGALLNREKEAAAWEADYQEKAANAREMLKDKLKPGMTAVLMEIDGGTIAVMGDNYGRGGEVIYNALQFKAPEWIQKNVIDNGVQYQEISMEKLPDIANADYIFLSTYTETSDAQLKSLTESKIWQGLPAVKNGNVIPLDYKTYFYFDAKSILGQIDTLAQTMLEQTSK
ncbi:iron-hydroxamate ABC transporter substrate-binding protein [Paenibacillus sp. JDR-2]|uniref:iron-hydroxamate ABC transporter substrate-binding protein n=1 Tax=Paenibacillus sp. (strain JDR-2) TaxID=324057 RepID=UPI000166B09E|nr:iron-hydroxamate ABC transporter substrate-binding protein [Paenibacillus sp. JDR-2]ACS99335.1 periplasmic binding protein [Paenibacillus sp. JDR-2]